MQSTELSRRIFSNCSFSASSSSSTRAAKWSACAILSFLATWMMLRRTLVTFSPSLRYGCELDSRYMYVRNVWCVRNVVCAGGGGRVYIGRARGCCE